MILVGKTICDAKPENETETYNPVDISEMNPEVKKLQVTKSDDSLEDLECSDVKIFTDTQSIATPAFNAYGTKYIVHITTQQNSASNFTIGSNKIQKIEDAFQVNRLLCSCLEGMRSMFAPKQIWR